MPGIVLTVPDFKTRSSHFTYQRPITPYRKSFVRSVSPRFDELMGRTAVRASVTAVRERTKRPGSAHLTVYFPSIPEKVWDFGTTVRLVDKCLSIHERKTLVIRANTSDKPCTIAPVKTLPDRALRSP